MNDKVMVVTGTAQGIGRVVAELAMERGWTVVGLDMRAVEPPEWQGREGWLGCIATTISDEGSVAEAVREVEARAGRVDALANCAAMFTTLKSGPLEELSLDEWDAAFAVNARGPVVLARGFAPLLRRSCQGAIVNIASNVVSYGPENLATYVSTKAAVVGLTRVLARELGRDGIRANAVSPAFVFTEITQELRSEEYRSRLVEQQCLKTPITPAEVAECVLFLASPAASAVTGQTLLVNKGTHMGAA